MSIIRSTSKLPPVNIRVESSDEGTRYFIGLQEVSIEALIEQGYYEEVKSPRYYEPPAIIRLRRCDICWSVVMFADTEKHTEWHTKGG